MAGDLILFQSHAGSIEAVIIGYLPRSNPPGFNPTLVRLRPGPAAPDALVEKEFQSHAGSIEA